LRSDRVETVSFAGKSYALDEFGFLDPPEQWDENFAIGMSQLLGMEGGLDERHWRVIRYLRRKLTEERTVPYFVIACMDNGLRIHEFREIFPAGFHRGACRIAGISYAFTVATNIALTYELTPMVWSKYPLSPAGFLQRFDAWDEEFAGAVARELDLPSIGDTHWRVIRFLRDYYRVHATVPTVHEACRAAGLTLKELTELFPGGYQGGACRMAGLPFGA
jgi:tRNA 2-thiouridine synthesizing protein E